MVKNSINICMLKLCCAQLTHCIVVAYVGVLIFAFFVRQNNLMKINSYESSWNERAHMLQHVFAQLLSCITTTANGLVQFFDWTTLHRLKHPINPYSYLVLQKKLIMKCIHLQINFTPISTLYVATCYANNQIHKH